MIGSQIWEEEKVKKIQKVKASAQKVFQKMLSVEEKNLPLYNQMIAGEISETFIDEVIIYDAEKIEIRFLFDDLIAEMTEKIEREEKEDVAV